MNLKTQWMLEDELRVRTLELEQARTARNLAAEQLYLESERARELDGRLQAAHRLIETYEANACAICRTALRALEGET